MIVPFDKLAGLLAFYDEEFARRGLDAAVWGHISDGNLHPNVIPRSFADVRVGQGRRCSRSAAKSSASGGSPLAEHGVGRNPVKQRLLSELYGAERDRRDARRQARDRSRVEARAGRAVPGALKRTTASTSTRLKIAAPTSARPITASHSASAPATPDEQRRRAPRRDDEAGRARSRRATVPGTRRRAPRGGTPTRRRSSHAQRRCAARHSGQQQQRAGPGGEGDARNQPQPADLAVPGLPEQLELEQPLRALPFRLDLLTLQLEPPAVPIEHLPEARRRPRPRAASRPDRARRPTMAPPFPLTGGEGGNAARGR